MVDGVAWGEVCSATDEKIPFPSEIVAVERDGDLERHRGGLFG